MKKISLIWVDTNCRYKRLIQNVHLRYRTEPFYGSINHGANDGNFVEESEREN